MVIDQPARPRRACVGDLRHAAAELRPVARLHAPAAATAACCDRHGSRSRSRRRPARRCPSPSADRDAGADAAISSSASRRRSSAEYQPEMQARPNGASAAFSACGSRGNLWPSSMPSKPASRASARQVSSGVSPPSLAHDRRSTSRSGWRRCGSACQSSFDQSICAALRARVDIIRARAASHLGALGDLGHRHVPPMAAGIGRGQRIGVDHDDARCGRAARALVSAASSSAMPCDLARDRAQAAAWAAKSISGSVS